MERVTTIGLDIAKSTFQVHGLDASGEVILRRRLTWARVCYGGEQTFTTAAREDRV
jgi:hypothetical protein